MANADKGDVAKMMRVPILLIDDSITKLMSFLGKAANGSEAIWIHRKGYKRNLPSCITAVKDVSDVDGWIEVVEDWNARKTRF